MKLLRKMERRFGRYAIRNLSLVVIATYVFGYLCQFVAPRVLSYFTLDPAMIFQHGQVWRLVTWILIPPESLDFFTIIMLFFYYSIAKVLERTWGDFLFNVYIFGGLILTVAGACVMYGVLMAVGSPPDVPGYGGAAVLLYSDSYEMDGMAVWSFPDLPVL